MSASDYKTRVLKIAREILAMRPGTHPKSALREASAIAKSRDTYRVTAEKKSGSGSRSDWDDLPGHVEATIRKQRQAASERKKSKRKLPDAEKVSGGGVTPR